LLRCIPAWEEGGDSCGAARLHRGSRRAVARGARWFAERGGSRRAVVRGGRWLAVLIDIGPLEEHAGPMHAHRPKIISQTVGFYIFSLEFLSE